MKRIKAGLLPKIIIAIIAGILCALFFPDWLVRIFLTVNALFGNFLNFIIPLLILGLVAPGIADLGKGAGRLLLVTALLAYGFTLFSGFFTYFTCDLVYPWLLSSADHTADVKESSVVLQPYFTVEMPAVMGVMSALILAFTLGLGMSVIDGNRLKLVMEDFKDIINQVIMSVIIPILPLYIFGIFLNMTIRVRLHGMGCFLENHCGYFYHDGDSIVYSVFCCWFCGEKESVSFVPEYVACIHDSPWDTVFSCNNPCDFGTNP